ncbi:2-polyprenyl-3-methyl-6-methoxy-1,4-benzoquinone monooxygenase [Bordetella bronchiseptica]|uniref:2-polyprenyl-3-methyl-6-methoxy-1,4-benzoquinone monooxygenase n=1 Tax=Bordetella bronchiseptica TaxID=518 RepID=UPI00028B92E5|nr:2-polyprenyl-3-methyl-6-methoxy-1,4-benzoquinone monooxygenase [Bordetella bronchiseptica]KCV32356.1 2-nonaprenyl-3-methyl-6-methoxy-1,4-benzoquinol hydroxylase [Bordetella bronchiseptica 00-P-2730]KDD51060.1 2-nonaprenyl-3-methyl-6-methoxy-1,4-benzoquinol hydroxylase [Bordetella bronchiseptica OSU553]AWQ03984.1 2-nonaprenyl-3-methyl-6-methoxy-1,4-benzoquinol hydroxylase [Bordetella bronchiseptica]KAK50164.1 2-nonaprenyl-3-methyl-6-methoxy-1,4-benzoquinol hydroxylase [Bordetella bronchisepti
MSTSSSASALGRRAGPLDGLIGEIDRALRVLSGAATAARPYPAQAPEAPDALSEREKRHAAGLMRVNHVGEVCAQALYRGQAAACREPAARELLRQAAAEEVDHLAWCNERLRELGSRPSLLNPFWYTGSFALGVLASYAGVPRNLGFMAETERQVEAHLDGHLRTLPVQDRRSRDIVQKMKEDEAQHRASAERAGGVPLPAPVRGAMRAMSKVMTSTAYWL